MADHVTIVEMGPRDGLQNEPEVVATADKIALIDALSATGLTRIEVASFVSPKWVPQMADGAEVLAGIKRQPGVTYSALTPNMRGLEAALAAGVDEVAVFASATEGFSRANINASISESLDRFAPVVAGALRAGVPVRGYVSCTVDCPYDGPTDPADVVRVSQALLDMGCHEISLGETLGRAPTDRVVAMLDTVTKVIPAKHLAGHFHDTGGVALANVSVALDYGVSVFDSAIGGLGGCPYAPGAAGNVATEALAKHLEALGYSTGLDHDNLAAAAKIARRITEPTHV
ncbi:MAG: hydroxymethylglutaryl-CoA lyase [Pseudomonadota bacterium]